MCAGEQIITTSEPGMTSRALLEHRLMRPVILPRDSQLDFAVCATISLLNTSGLRVKMLIFQLGFKWPMTAIEAHARLPPPAKVT